MNHQADVAIVGGGIVGLSHAYFALKRGYRVVLFEREHFATGASVRNFGMIWPIGQEPGDGLDLAMRSREHWLEFGSRAGFQVQQGGSLHLAYEQDEWEVLQEFYSRFGKEGYQCKLLPPREITGRVPHVRQAGLSGGLWSSSEMTVYAREAIRRIPRWLESEFGLVLRFGQTVTGIDHPVIETFNEKWEVHRIVVCSGADFETLYPSALAALNLKKCKLQMMKLLPSRPLEGPSLCGGLTLRHYASFSKCATLKKVDERFDALDPLLKEWGIHILVAHTAQGELIVGDSHTYGQTAEPFDNPEIDRLILEYFDRFIDCDSYQVIERWHGVYPKYADGLYAILEPAPGVQIVNGLGGAGMTLSPALAEKVVSNW